MTAQPAPAPDAVAAALALTGRTEERRQAAAAGLDAKRRVTLGQFFTPARVSDFIAATVRLPETGRLRLLDPGAGVGSLTAALLARIVKERPGLEVELVACEFDATLHETLAATLADCAETAAAHGVKISTRLEPGDFVEWAAQTPAPGPFDIVIMNPPYRKLAGASRQRSVVESRTTAVSNLYAAFLAMGVHLLAPQGQLVAITPRSFTNGPYFRNFRRYLLDRMQLDRIHVFESRTSLFGDADVLQENVVFSATRADGVPRGPVTISTSAADHDVPRTRTAPYGEVVLTGDPELFIHISGADDDHELAALLAGLPGRLPGLGLTVSTGRVVDFRAKEHLRQDPGPGDLPLIYPLHMSDGKVVWPVRGARKPNAVVANEATAKLAFPAGNYVIVKRMSAKEERRRVVAAVYAASEQPGTAVAFENHVNVFHTKGAGLPIALARGLSLWLNSTVLDSFIRRFNGHTQINATDLRNLGYPSAAELTSLGEAIGDGAWPDQAKIDQLVATHVAACRTRA